MLGELWLALIGWHSGASKLGRRDRWIGWLPEKQFRRLHLIANNTRFLILPGCGAATPASRVPGLSVRRRSHDFRAARYVMTAGEIHMALSISVTRSSAVVGR